MTEQVKTPKYTYEDLQDGDILCDINERHQWYVTRGNLSYKADDQVIHDIKVLNGPGAPSWFIIKFKGAPIEKMKWVDLCNGQPIKYLNEESEKTKPEEKPTINITKIFNDLDKLISDFRIEELEKKKQYNQSVLMINELYGWLTQFEGVPVRGGRLRIKKRGGSIEIRLSPLSAIRLRRWFRPNYYGSITTYPDYCFERIKVTSDLEHHKKEFLKMLKLNIIPEKLTKMYPKGGEMEV